MHGENFQRVEKKSPGRIIAQKLRTDYGLLGDKVIDLLSCDILTWYKEIHTDAETLSHGQTVWLAVDVTEKHHQNL